MLNPGARFPTDWAHCCTKKVFYKKVEQKMLCREQIVSVVFPVNRWDFVLWRMHDRWITENSIITDRSQNFSSSRVCTSTGKWNLSYTWPERTGEICQVPASSTSFWHFDIAEIYKVLGCLVYSHQEAQTIEIWIDSGDENWFKGRVCVCVEVCVFCLHACDSMRACEPGRSILIQQVAHLISKRVC